MLLLLLSQTSKKRWRKSFFSILIITIAFLHFYINTKKPRNYNNFDKIILTISTPVQDFLTISYNRSLDFWRNYLFLVNIKKENVELKTYIEGLQSKLNEFREIDIENQRLKKLLHFASSQTLPFRTARVVGYEPNSHYKLLKVNIGEMNGVKQGMAVVTDQGVIGRILNTLPYCANVLLITDTRSSVDSLVQRTRARGNVQGMGGGVLEMKYILRLDEVQEGDIVVTSGFDGIFPNGLKVGSVSKLKRNVSGVFQEVQVVPALDLSHVEEVIIFDIPTQPQGELTGPPYL